MTGKTPAEVPNMAQRTLLQCLSMDDWKIVAHLPVPAGELMLSRLLHHGWIESRGIIGMVETRAAPRHRVMKPAKIEFGGHKRDCVIRDLRPVAENTKTR